MPMSNLPWDKSELSDTNSAAELLRKLFKANEEFTKLVGEQLQVNPTDFKVMEHLIENGPSTPGDLANAVGVTAGALTQSLDRLEAVGHTHRERNPNDRRSVSVVANPASVDRAWGAIMPLIQASNSTTSSMSDIERKAVVTFLSEMLAIYERRTESAKSNPTA
jgi:DNA-binding MarR family transcriptional regulator